MEVEVCKKNAEDLKVLTDPIIHWVSCYEMLIKKFDVMQKDLKEEFKFYL